MTLCLIAAGKVTVLAAGVFTLSWTHSVEKVRWEEDWRLTENGLVIDEARVRGSGAGMEPPAGAVLRDGWWVYTPSMPPRPSLLLAQSGATGAGWDACSGGTCLEIGALAGEVAEIRACRTDDPQ